MNIKTIFFFALLLMFIFHPLHASESAWFANGKPSQDTENEKSKDGFGVQLWLTTDGNLYEEWSKPEVPEWTVTKRAKRNKPVYAVIIFINPPVNEKGECDISGDILIRQPDGKVYADIKDFKIWQNKPAPPKNNIGLAENDVTIMIENNDPLGIYTIDVLVKDRVKKITIPLHYEFIAEE
ncbi:MAG: hypothetical protein A2987_03445 [Omnitrophica bacterium RIFCSPLOWO2_01_FULL_45_10]|nr:MAG: hypothetical protein A2987_03445 [Omnitrophica bacterium RIFCSPLOWO2_01_FULL_45_10]